jgi:hypothetical protein
MKRVEQTIRQNKVSRGVPTSTLWCIFAGAEPLTDQVAVVSTGTHRPHQGDARLISRAVWVLRMAYLRF